MQMLMAGGRALLCSTQLRLYFALILIILIILGTSGLRLVSNTRTRCLDCIWAILGSRHSVNLLSHASRSGKASECPTTAIEWQHFDPLLTLLMTSSLISDLFK